MHCTQAISFESSPRSTEIFGQSSRFKSEVEAMEQTEYRKHTRAVHVNNPPEVLTVNNDETNQILKRSLYIIEQNKPSFERNACNMESLVNRYFM